ncbi:MAG: histidine ammonia-lyase [Rectinemataceae bacterium]|jgi:histidine ammonia-lyase
MDTISIDGRSLDLEGVARVARGGARAVLAPAALESMAESRAIVDACVDRGLVRYGITTGFGKFSDVVISAEDNETLQRNLIMSHACGLGDPFPGEVVRAMLLLRANALAVGRSGIRPSTVEALVAMLNAGVVPVVPEKGSLGASGDLVPLAHLVLVLMGMGEAVHRGRRMPGSQALAEAGLKTVTLAAKEGLALINGTQAMTAVGALASRDALALVEAAELAAALSFQALRGITDALDPRIHELRGQGGQTASAAALRGLLAGSSLTTRQGQERVQDAYALRCVPQVHGASRDAVEYAASVVGRELNAVTDNPLILPNGDIISGGNFHGQPVALAMDFLGIALCELAGISERRIERLVNPSLSNGLPAFLAPRGGLNSGFMISQYTAAALVSEDKILAHPASVDSIPSSANQEDHVSMGTIAARKARTILENTQRVLAIEFLAACQAIDLRAAAMGRGFPGDGSALTMLSPPTRGAYRALREKVSFMAEDRVLYPDIEAARELLIGGGLFTSSELSADG